MTTLSELIRSVTDNCPRADCSLAETGGVTTLLGWSARYDKHGNRSSDRSSDDPNVYRSTLSCSACLRRWLTRTQGGQTTITDARHPSTT